MKRALFRWYVGEPDTPFWIYPKGWRWIKPSDWYYSKWMTLFSTHFWKKYGDRALHDFVIYGIAFPYVPWSEE